MQQSQPVPNSFSPTQPSNHTLPSTNHIKSFIVSPFPSFNPPSTPSNTPNSPLSPPHQPAPARDVSAHFGDCWRHVDVRLQGYSIELQYRHIGRQTCSTAPKTRSWSSCCSSSSCPTRRSSARESPRNCPLAAICCDLLHVHGVQPWK